MSRGFNEPTYCPTCGWMPPARTRARTTRRTNAPTWRDDTSVLVELLDRRPDLVDFPGLGARLAAIAGETA